MSEHYMPLDPGRVDLLDPLERDYWCREFGCTADALADAVAAVGTHTTEVREHLRSTGGSSA